MILMILQESAEYFSCIFVAVYIINILTTNISAKAPRKRKKPRPLSKGFRAAMRQSGITAVQIISLSEVYSSEKLDGGIFPQSAEMRVISLSEGKWNTLWKRGMKVYVQYMRGKQVLLCLWTHCVILCFWIM